MEIATLKLSIDSPPVERFKYAREWIKKLETDVDDLGDDTHDIAKKLKFSNWFLFFIFTTYFDKYINI